MNQVKELEIESRVWDVIHTYPHLRWVSLKMGRGLFSFLLGLRIPRLLIC